MRKIRTKKQCYGAVRVDWEAAVKSLAAASKTPLSGPALLLIAQQVLNGKWGNGTERKERLTAAGYKPAEIQSLANSLANGTLKVSITASILRVRSGPGDDKTVVQRLQYGVVQTVTEVREGIGSDNGWGKISTGWISLDHVAVL